MGSTMQFSEVRVLLVERHAQNVSLYRFALEDMGFAQTICASNTEEALDQMYFNAPSLIILGDELYPKSVPEFTSDIRSGKTGAPKAVPIIVIHAKPANGAAKPVNGNGVVKYVSAPFSTENLLAQITAALENPAALADKAGYGGPHPRRRKAPRKNKTIS